MMMQRRCLVSERQTGLQTTGPPPLARPKKEKKNRPGAPFAGRCLGSTPPSGTPTVSHTMLAHGAHPPGTAQQRVHWCEGSTTAP